MISILKTTPSSITLKVGSKTIKVLGESFVRGFGSPDFIIDVSSIKSWDKPDDSITLTEDERKFILQYLLDELTRRKWIVVAE
jgi:hypothetical protein